MQRSNFSKFVCIHCNANRGSESKKSMFRGLDRDYETTVDDGSIGAKFYRLSRKNKTAQAVGFYL